MPAATTRISLPQPHPRNPKRAAAIPGITCITEFKRLPVFQREANAADGGSLSSPPPWSEALTELATAAV